MHYEMGQRHNFGRCLVFVVIVAAILTDGLLGWSKSRENTPRSAQDNPSRQPIGKTAGPANWQSYSRGQLVANSGIRINYPQGWTVELRTAQGQQASVSGMPLRHLEFDFLPPAIQANPQSSGWLGWGGMSVDVSDKASDIHEWITTMFPDLTGDIDVTTTVVGNKPAYYLMARGGTTNPAAEGFTPRWVVFGSRYTYDVGFSQNGVNDFEFQLRRNIFPVIRFD
jgi:hypothetical protein